jgi:hypothetical protein
MKRIAVSVVVAALVAIPLVQAVDAEVRVNVNVGVPALPIPVVPVAVPMPSPPRIVLSAPPEFLLPSTLGVYAAVGIPYDMFYSDNTYYVYRDDRWYRGNHYNGPWRTISRRQLPPGLRRHKYEQVRYLRDEEYRSYRDDHDRYRGKHFRPDKEWKERRKEEKEQWKEERRSEKDERRAEFGERRSEGDGSRHGAGRGRND